jgi:hypothetical protein
MYRKNKRCRGTIEKEPQPFLLTMEDGTDKKVYACTKCRRLYFENGEPVKSEDGRYVMLVNNIPILIGGDIPVMPNSRS